MVIHSVVVGLLLFMASPALANPHERAFDRIKKLEGKWKGKSTRGWSEEMTYRVIAAGSVVMVTSFDAHPNETMLTTFKLHSGRLMLTHYCVAGNQPRLAAGEVSDDGRKIVHFTSCTHRTAGRCTCSPNG